jgi:hypothetical protein
MPIIVDVEAGVGAGGVEGAVEVGAGGVGAGGVVTGGVGAGGVGAGGAVGVVVEYCSGGSQKGEYDIISLYIVRSFDPHSKQWPQICDTHTLFSTIFLEHFPIPKFSLKPGSHGFIHLIFPTISPSWHFN